MNGGMIVVVVEALSVRNQADSFLGNCCSLYNATSSVLKGGGIFSVN